MITPSAEESLLDIKFKLEGVWIELSKLNGNLESIAQNLKALNRDAPPPSFGGHTRMT